MTDALLFDSFQVSFPPPYCVALNTENFSFHSTSTFNNLQYFAYVYV
jgi:hypothetical protein